jgi:putative peptidoglycan lipid II flippase
MHSTAPASALAKPVARIGGGTLVSRLLGFARDLLIARLFGASAATDAFFVAFRIPNLVRRLFAEGTFAAALVPLLIRARRGEQGEQAAREVVAELAGSLTALLLLMTAVSVLVAPALVLALAPGFVADGTQLELTTRLLRLMLPYLLLIGLTAFAAAVLNSLERFAVPAFTPALLNLAMIGCALALAPRLAQPIVALAWGVLIGGIAQLAVQLLALGRLGFLRLPRLNGQTPAWRAFLRALGPTLIALSATQINLLLDTLLASFLITGSISWLYYAERLMDFPLGILGAALSTAILPRLVRNHQMGTTQDDRTLDWALRWAILLGVPAAAGLALVAEPIMVALFQSPQFSLADAREAGRALMAYALGLPCFMALKVMTPVFFSQENLITPLRIALITIAANLLLNLLLMGPLGHAGLALATSLAATLGAGLMLRAMLAAKMARLARGWIALLLRIGASTLVMMAALWALATADWVVPGAPAVPMRMLALATLITAGLLSYGLSFIALGGRPRHLLPQGLSERVEG